MPRLTRCSGRTAPVAGANPAVDLVTCSLARCAERRALDGEASCSIASIADAPDRRVVHDDVGVIVLPLAAKVPPAKFSGNRGVMAAWGLAVAGNRRWARAVWAAAWEVERRRATLQRWWDTADELSRKTSGNAMGISPLSSPSIRLPWRSSMLGRVGAATEFMTALPDAFSVALLDCEEDDEEIEDVAEMPPRVSNSEAETSSLVDLPIVLELPDDPVLVAGGLSVA